MNFLEKLEIKAEWATKRHNRMLSKPNEDRIFIDEKNRIFILLDGVTRVHKEYEEAPDTSSAGDIGDLFIEEVCKHLKENAENAEPEALLREAVRKANSRIKEYREKKSENEWEYYPATLGIVSVLKGNTLHYVSCGDCAAVLLRKNAKIIMGYEWTLDAHDVIDVSKKERYARYCNHPENDLSYTIYNGDDAVVDGIEYSFVDLHSGDTLVIVSDGMGDYVRYEKIKTLLEYSPEEMIALSSKYDEPPFGEYADDKSVIKISLSIPNKTETELEK